MKKRSVIYIILIVGSLLFLAYYHIVQPYFSNKTTDAYRDLYYSDTDASDDSADASEGAGNITVSGAPDSLGSTTDDPPENGNSALPVNYGKFESLIDKNSDICGWITVPGTNIDYPVVSANEDTTEYYLTHNTGGEEDKNGSLFTDYRTPLTEDSKVIVINGHNMQSTGLMFHELTAYKKLDFYQENPTLTFDTLYGDGEWKIIALIKTNNNEKHGERFNYFRSEFASDTEFLDFVYELKLRSIFDCPVTANEDDTLLILSTCTYEMNDMRFLVVARKVRENEDSTVDTSLSSKRSGVLYFDAWYEYHGGTRPTVTSFAESYAANEITWYDGDITLP